MKNILIISPHFPTPDVYVDISKDPRSKFLINYAIQWQKMGHSVTIIHPIQKYPQVINAAIKIVSKISTKYTRFIQNDETTTSAIFEAFGLKFIRRPLLKILPHFKISESRIRKFCREINQDVIFPIGNYDLVFLDYVSPSLDIFGHLNFDSKVYTIFHQTDERYLTEHLTHYRNLLSKCTGVLFRNKTALDKFIYKFDLKCKPHLMFSGIPVQQNFGNRRDYARKYLYVGRIIESKNIQDIIYAISYLPSNIKENITFEIVGDGEYKNHLISLVYELNLTHIVTFSPKVAHSVVFEKMKVCDVFVMVSKETFGMVYVEALSQGCVVIAAKGEGIDGIIENKVNGYLVTLHDRTGLSELINSLYHSDITIINSVTENSLMTAQNMKEDYLARKLIEALV